MISLQTLVEWFATISEGCIVFLIIISITGVRYTSLLKQSFLFILSNILYFTAITALNHVNGLFSFLTIYVGIIIFWICSYPIAQKNHLLRFMASIVSMLMLTTIDYCTGFATALIVGKSSDIYEGFTLAMGYGTIRTLYTIIDKFIQFLVLIILRPLYKKLRTLNHFYQITVSIISFAALIISSLLLNMILSESQVISQTAIILSWMFVLFCVVLLIAFCCTNMQLSNERYEKAMIMQHNSLMENNYSIISQKNEALRMQAHDFKNHLHTIQQLDLDRIHEYITSLLENYQNITPTCHTGHLLIDAILNCKIEYAKQNHIDLTYMVYIPRPVDISPADICAVLSNQLDNAIEACMKIETESSRWIRIRIEEKMDFIAFIVENSIKKDSLEPNSPLHSTKVDADQGIHGLGLKSIKSATEKYNGSFVTEISTDTFSAKALLQMSSSEGDQNAS